MGNDKVSAIEEENKELNDRVKILNKLVLEKAEREIEKVVAEQKEAMFTKGVCSLECQKTIV
jgi:hypothetical protein